MGASSRPEARPHFSEHRDRQSGRSNEAGAVPRPPTHTFGRRTGRSVKLDLIKHLHGVAEYLGFAAAVLVHMAARCIRDHEPPTDP